MRPRRAKRVSEIWPCDGENNRRGILIPKEMWPLVFNFTPPEQPKLPALVAVDDVIMTNSHEDMRFRVVKIDGPITQVPTLWGDTPRPPHYKITAIDAKRAYPERIDVYIFNTVVGLGGKLVDLYKQSRLRFYIVKRGKISQILADGRKRMMPKIAKGLEDVKPNDFANALHRITIPVKRDVWLKIFRFTPKGQPTVKDLVRRGDIVQQMELDIKGSVFLSPRYRVLRVIGPIRQSEPYDNKFEVRPPFFNLEMLLETDSPNSKRFCHLESLVAVNREILHLYKNNPNKVIIVEKGPIWSILEKYKNKD